MKTEFVNRRTWIIAGAAFIIAAWPLAASTTTLRNDATYPDLCVDAQVNGISGNQDTNYDDTGTINVYEYGTNGDSEYYETYIKFNLKQAVDNGLLPAGVTITGCTLRLYCSRENSGDASDPYWIYKLNEAWGESSITYNNRPSTPGWHAEDTPSPTPEVTGTFDDYTNLSGTTTNDLNPPWPVDIDLQYYVDDGSIQSWMSDDTTNFGWVIAAGVTAPDSNNMNFTFRDCEFQGSNGSYHPELILTYKEVGANPASINVTADSINRDPADTTVTVTNAGTGTVNVTITESADFMNVTPTSLSLNPGGGTGTFQVDWYALEAAAGINNSSITLTLSGTSQSPITIPVTLTVNDNIQTEVVTNPTSLELNEGDSSSFAVTLGGEPNPTLHPTITVNIAGYTSSFTGDASVVFLAAQWNAAHTVNVSAVQDADLNNETGTLVLSANPPLLAGTLAFQIWDDDALNLITTPASSQSVDITEDAAAGVSLQMRLNKSAAQTVTLSSPNSIYVRIGTQATYNASDALATRNVDLSSTPVTVYIYYVDDGDTSNNSATLRVQDASGNDINNCPMDFTLNVTDDDMVNYVIADPADASWVPADGVQVSIDQSTVSHIQVSLSKTPAGTENIYVTIISGSVEIGTDGVSYSGGPLTLTFGSLTYDQPQDVYIRATTGASVGSALVRISNLSSGAPDVDIDVSIVTTYHVTGTITLTGSLQDVTEVTATLCDTTLDHNPIAGVSPVTVTGTGTSGTYSIAGVLPGSYVVMLTSQFYDLLIGGTTPAYTGTVTVAGSDADAGSYTVDSTGKKKSGGGGGGCALENVASQAGGALAVGLLLLVGIASRRRR